MSQTMTNDTVRVAVQLAKSAAAKHTLLALPRSATVADLIAQLKCGKAATLLVHDCTPAASTTLGDLHDCCSAEDGMLHVTMLVDKTFGDAHAIGCCQTRIEHDDGHGKKRQVAKSGCFNIAVVE